MVKNPLAMQETWDIQIHKANTNRHEGKIDKNASMVEGINTPLTSVYRFFQTEGQDGNRIPKLYYETVRPN